MKINLLIVFMAALFTNSVYAASNQNQSTQLPALLLQGQKLPSSDIPEPKENEARIGASPTHNMVILDVNDKFMVFKKYAISLWRPI
ncbi:MAG: hypothetical protein HOO93_18740 [Methyloglobulus sp.]|nr:hypothetical protein [Methyloglobulus sp.]